MRQLNKCVLKVAPLLVAMTASGQNLPKVQTRGFYAPPTVKIDGKAMEWDYTYQAYDSANNIYYTIANDDNNLYLVIHTSEKRAINKIFVGGVSLTLTATNYPPVKITYPRPGNNGTYLHTKDTFDELKKAGETKEKEVKDLIRLKNSEFENEHKEIGLKGMAEFSEPTLSIYNDKGIKVKALFDNDLAYTYELALPLKFLPWEKDNLNKFRYVIQLNGSELDNGKMLPRMIILNAQGQEVHDMDMLYTENPTNFGGEYTLAKK